ncbi:uncharacterized protein LOC129972319 [Argiope bruennichi]|uniref:uncharacterized protein LOC129972319 n=1 Tax=Argiope bruennichi TaxID=94029 RepID=UPI0024957AFB|nr:uncharacterized protein LOC129972319 [Argiope bruennichi]
MGEDRTTCSEKKPNDVIAPPCRHRHSSVISSCSEDAESESTSTGYPQSPDEEKEEELEYGPGIVNKLRTRFLSISLKQNRGINSMRRSCSMENLLDQDRPCKSLEKNLGIVNGVQTTTPWGNLKKAKSMDSLLAEMRPDSPSMKDLHLETNGESKKIPRIVKNRECCLSRLCDEELPKPDTVKTYKRMFEPAESRRGSHCRRPPVLRASAKSCAASKINGVATNTSAKVNGVATKSKCSAKQSPPLKAQSTPESAPAINGNVKKPVVNGEPSRPLYNGCHIVKASPVKVTNNSALKNGKDVEKNLNSINRLMNKKEVHFSNKADVIINGNGCHNEILKIKANDEVVKQFNKPIVNNLIVNGNLKPKVPSNRPSLKSPKPVLNKPEEQKVNDKIIPPKLKPKLTNGLKKPFEVEPKIAPAVPPREVAKDPELNKSKVEPTSPEIGKEEIKFPVDDEKKDIPELQPENKMNGDIPLTVENNSEKEETTPQDERSPHTPTEPKKKEDIKPLVKENRKISERTGHSDLRNTSNKLPKAPVLNSPLKPENGHLSLLSTDKSHTSKQETVQDKEVKRDFRPVKKQKSPQQTTSIVFDFRGKDVVPHVAVMPTPFGCKSLHPKKRPVVDGKEVPNGAATDDEDEDYVDYSVPPPCGVIFEGENVKIGRGSILATRNKDLKITFDDDVDSNTFVYPSETSLLEEMDRSLSPTTPPENEIIPNGQPPPSSSKLKINTSIGNSSAGGLSTYTPSVLRTVDNFEPGMFRPSSAPPEKEDEKNRNSEEEENKEIRDEHDGDASSEMLKPADPDLISSWSLSAGTSDLLF